MLEELSWQVIEAPANDHGKPVVLEGSDVLFTGKEIFVGTRKNGTNMEGAMVSSFHLLVYFDTDLYYICSHIKIAVLIDILTFSLNSNMCMNYKRINKYEDCRSLVERFRIWRLSR